MAASLSKSDLRSLVYTLGYFRDAGTVSDGALAFAPLLVFGFGNDRCGLFCVREAARQSSELWFGAHRTRGTEPADLYVAPPASRHRTLIRLPGLFCDASATCVPAVFFAIPAFGQDFCRGARVPALSRGAKAAGESLGQPFRAIGKTEKSIINVLK